MHSKHQNQPAVVEIQHNFSIVAVSYNADMSRIATDVKPTNDFGDQVPHVRPRIAVDVVDAS